MTTEKYKTTTVEFTSTSYDSIQIEIHYGIFAYCKTITICYDQSTTNPDDYCINEIVGYDDNEREIVIINGLSDLRHLIRIGRNTSTVKDIIMTHWLDGLEPNVWDD